MQFGEYIKNLRNQQELTQPQAADLMGIEQSYLSKLENNKAVPSAEIFEKLQRALKFEMSDLSEAIDADEFKRLEEIVLVKTYLAEEHRAKTKSQRRLRFFSVALLMASSFFLTYGYMLKDNMNHAYIYESKGVVKEDESMFVFAELPHYEQFNRLMQHNHSEIAKHPMFNRLDFDQIIYSEFRGNFFDMSVKDGKRRYFLIKQRQKAMPTPFYLGISFGILLLTGGIGGLFLSRQST